MLAGIAQQQRSGVDELGGRRLSAVRKCFQPAAFFFGKGNLISGCHAPIIHQQKSAVNMRNVTCYMVLAVPVRVTCHGMPPVLKKPPELPPKSQRVGPPKVASAARVTAVSALPLSYAGP